MDCPQVIYREHALKRMFERSITADVVEDILANGEVIRTYPDDKPFISHLLLGYIDNLRFTLSLQRTTRYAMS